MDSILMNLNQVVLITGLAIESIYDIRFKRIPLWIFFAMAGLGSITGIIFWIVNSTDIKSAVISRAIAVVVGLILIFISRLSNEAIGYGDSLTLTIIGLFMGIEILLQVLLTSISIAGAVGLVFLLFFRKSRKYQLSFVPFIFVSYVILRFLK